MGREVDVRRHFVVAADGAQTWGGRGQKASDKSEVRMVGAILNFSHRAWERVGEKKRNLFAGTKTILMRKR